MNKQSGVMKWWNPAKGYGFIRDEAQTMDIFVHYSALPEADQFKELEGMKVSFELVTGPKGPQAFSVEVSHE